MTIADKAVVLLSGGIDSSTALAMVSHEGFEVYALSFDYGQRHKRELKSARDVAQTFNVKKHLVIEINLREIGGSALTSAAGIPKRESASGIPVTYVPARNTIFLAFGLAWAEVLGVPEIVIGANTVDYSGYPDCRPEYLKAFEEMANLATRESVEGRITFRVKAPLLHLTKGEIIRRGVALGLDYGLTWSCYDPQPFPLNRRESEASPQTGYLPCGECDSCRFRGKGFSEAGLPDPLLTSQGKQRKI